MPRFKVHLSPTVRVLVDAFDAVDHAAGGQMLHMNLLPDSKPV